MSEILTKELIVAAGSATTKEDAIAEAGNLLVAAGALTPAYVDAMLERERSFSTSMGSYLEIPHGTNEAKDAITRSAISLVRCEDPIDPATSRFSGTGRGRRLPRRAGTP